MLPPAPHYEPCQDYILQGDIGYFPFAQIVLPTESEGLPGPASTNPRVPAFEGMITHDLVVDGVTYQLRRWRGLGMVIDATSELANSPDDNRVTVIPIVTADVSGANWDATMRGEVVGAIPLPACKRGEGAHGMPISDMPELVALPRTAVCISRGVALADRMMTLTPRMAAFAAVKLGAMFYERTFARIDHLDNVIGSVLVEVLDSGRINEPPPKAGWAVLAFANHERIQVYLHHRGA